MIHSKLLERRGIGGEVFYSMRNHVLKMNLLALAALTLVVTLFAQTGADNAQLTVEPGTTTTEAEFCAQYLDWLCYRAALGRVDAGWPQRLEQVKFAAKEHLKYLDEQPFLSTTAEAYHKFLKELDEMQGRVLRWKNSGAKNPDYSEAVAGYLRKTVFDKGAEISSAERQQNYFAARLAAENGFPQAERTLDRKLLTDCYDAYIGAWANVPPPKIYDSFRIDVLRKGVVAGRLAALLGGDKADKSFPASINPDDAGHLLRVCATLRELNPADADGEIRAAASVARWGTGDLAGAYAEAVPVLALRKTDAPFGVFCARMASAMGKGEEALVWLQESARLGLTLIPSADFLRQNPDFEALRNGNPTEFNRLLYTVASLETLQKTLAVAKQVAANPSDLTLYKTLYEQIPMLADQPNVRSHALCTVIAGLRYNGRDSGMEEMENRLESYSPPLSLRKQINLKSLMDACAPCNGSGIDLKKNARCRQCAGTGVCKFEYCNKGIRISPFDRLGAERQPCGACSGSGVCRYCKGKGKEICTICEGRGKSISKAKTEAVVKALAERTIALAGAALSGK